jgi:hypothetical protein
LQNIVAVVTLFDRIVDVELFRIRMFIFTAGFILPAGAIQAPGQELKEEE